MSDDSSRLMSSTRFLIQDKRWSVDLEKRIQEEHYADQEAYNARYGFDPASGREIFVIDTPPPYPSGTWHIGAVAQYSIIDMIARSQRLLGKEVYFPWGVDRNGINIEFTVERNNGGRKMRSYDRTEFLRMCEETIEAFTQAMRKTATRAGLSCDFAKEYRTDSAEYRTVTQAVFLDLFKRGEIIEELRPNMYDPIEGTTIADAEVERLPRKTQLVDVIWSMADGGEELIISTTRPELICACGVILVHPDDSRYEHLVGREALPPPPFAQHPIEIRAHESVKQDFGSGVLMVCSYGDKNDVVVFRHFGLTPLQAIDVDGRMTDLAGPSLQGLRVSDARAAAIKALQTAGRIAGIVSWEQEVPVSERGKNPVEILLLKEWYVRQTHVQDRMREHIENIRFIPSGNNNGKQALLNWMKNITIEWPISRRRWYHTEIPIWYVENDESKVIIPPPGKYVRPWCENPPSGSRVLDRTSRADLGTYESLAPALGCCVGEEKVFDTWMDSSNSNLFVSGYAKSFGMLNMDTDFDKAFPTGIRTQGKEIVRTWLYYTLLKSTLLLDKPGFKHVWIDGLGMDPWGRKMSKSLGNGIDADSVLECGAGGRSGIWKLKGPGGKTKQLKAQKIGSECFRLWKACDAKVGEDFNIDPEQIEANYFGILTKMFNIARFASQFPVPQDLESAPSATLQLGDRWILAEFTELLQQVEDAYQGFDIFSASRALKNFGTGLLSSHWLELAKPRLHAGDLSSTWTLHRILRDWITLFSPVCPIFTHYLSQTLYHRSAVDIRELPKPVIVDAAEVKKLCELSKPLCDFNSQVWRAKHVSAMSFNESIAGITIPEAIAAISPDLIAMHKFI